jgi:hypothetical protein
MIAIKHHVFGNNHGKPPLGVTGVPILTLQVSFDPLQCNPHAILLRQLPTQKVQMWRTTMAKMAIKAALTVEF